MNFNTLKELEDSVNKFSKIETFLEMICDVYFINIENNSFDSIYALLNALVSSATQSLFETTEKLFEEFRANKQEISI